MLNAPITPLPGTSPLPAAAPAPAAVAAEPGAFARQLERASAADATTAPAPGAAPAAPAAPREARAKPRGDGERGKAEKAPARPAQAPAQEHAASDPAAPADAAETPLTSVATDAATLLASLLNRAVSAPVAASAEAAAGAGAQAAVGVGEARRAAPGEPAATAAAAVAAAGPLAAGGEPVQTRRERAETGPTLNPVASDTPAFMLAQAATQGAQAGTPSDAVAAAPTPYASQIQAPVGSPEFAPGLSAQVSVMVREGLQEARLQLNPAEMGPITVQIQIDGGTAQVTMTAEQAPTRQALEQAMPTLAGALREEGLTLTGGGVFEQPRQARDGAANGSTDTRSGRSSDDGDAAPAAAPQRATPRGMVDLFA